jgi:hypothetical protein
VASSGIIFVQNFIKVCPTVLEVKHADRHNVPVCFDFSHVQAMSNNQKQDNDFLICLPSSLYPKEPNLFQLCHPATL